MSLKSRHGLDGVFRNGNFPLVCGWDKVCIVSFFIGALYGLLIRQGKVAFLAKILKSLSFRIQFRQNKAVCVKYWPTGEAVKWASCICYKVCQDPFSE